MKRHLTRFPRWLRYRRYLRALVIDAGRQREPLGRRELADLKDQARTAAGTGRLTGSRG